MIAEVWGVMIDGPNDPDVYLAAACRADADKRAEDANDMFRRFHLTRYATVVRWPDTAEDHAQALKDGDPDWD